MVDGDRDTETDGTTRARAALVVTPFFLVGVGNLVLILLWGIDPVWGFLILPPVLFICVLGYIAVRTGFARDRTGPPDEPAPDSEFRR